MLDQLNLSILLDICLLVMLGATISYCFVLNRKLNHMRQAQAEMKDIAKGFDQSIVRTKLGVEELKSMSETKGAELKKYITVAEKLIEELSLMTASGSRIADRMQNASSKSYPNASAKKDLPGKKQSKSEDKADVALTDESVFRSDASIKFC